MPGVMQLATGAWFEPQDTAVDNSICIHGNPNILTRDIGTSKLSQGSTGQIAKVEIELFTGNLPPVRVFEAMTFTPRDKASSSPGHHRPPERGGNSRASETPIQTVGKMAIK
jgi:biotin/methionine sulfoxide reductase